MSDVTGRPVSSSPALLAFRDWLVEQSATNVDRRFINGTGGGVLAGGRIEQQVLSDALSALPERFSSSAESVARVMKSEPQSTQSSVGAAWVKGRQTGAPDLPSIGQVLSALSRGSSE